MEKKYRPLVISLPTRVITFKADKELIEKIDRLARMLGGTRSDIIRMAVIHYIKSFEQEKMKRTMELKPVIVRVKESGKYILKK